VTFLAPLLTEFTPVVSPVFSPVVSPVFTPVFSTLFSPFVSRVIPAAMTVVRLGAQPAAGERDDEQSDAGSDLHGRDPPTWIFAGFDARATGNLHPPAAFLECVHAYIIVGTRRQMSASASIATRHHQECDWSTC
jgi:hypothetical protein